MKVDRLSFARRSMAERNIARSERLGTVARVEWTRHPDDVEPVVGMLVCSRYPNAVRVQPSQGDGGVDVFVPGEAGFGTEREVYQVKSYCKHRLTSSQKRKIKRSFDDVIQTAADEGSRRSRMAPGHADGHDG